MSVQIYAGNLAYKMTENDLRKLFEAYGTVTYVRIIKDRDTNQSKGFGFVDMESEDDANAAIENLNGSDQQGRTLKVNIAKPKDAKEPREQKDYTKKTFNKDYNKSSKPRSNY